ncbi:NF7O factor, partial [Crotophaga sulcirostris]|nr:NF7O factor [Crotophaga sulcirostris]
GVAVESVRRKDTVAMAMSKIWALHLDSELQYTMFQIPLIQLAWQEELWRIRVRLDYGASQVTFYNVENMVQVLQFKVSFTEKVVPYFWHWLHKTHIQMRA